MDFHATVGLGWHSQVEARIIRAGGGTEYLGVVAPWRGLKAPARFWKRLWAILKREGKIPIAMGFGAFVSWWFSGDLSSGVSVGLITSAGQDYAAGNFANDGNDVSEIKYLGTGTGTNAENIADVGLQTPIAGIARVTCVQSKPGTRQFRLVGSVIYNGTYAVAEAGWFTEAGAGSPPSGGTLWDRRRINPTAGMNDLDILQLTYTCELVGGGT